MESALSLAEDLLGDGGHHSMVFCEANLLSLVGSSSTVQAALRDADTVLADGVALTMLARLKGHELPGRVAGPWFFLAAMEYGVKRGWRHYFYGGAPGVAERLAEQMRVRYPGIQIVGTCSPPFRTLSHADEADAKNRIESGGTQLLWVGLGGPKQESWIRDHKAKINVPLMLAVGAAFDFHSGNRPWAPLWVRKIGMEWLFRMLTGGRKTFFRNVRCVSVVSWILFKAALAYPFLKKPVGAEGEDRRAERTGPG